MTEEGDLIEKLQKWVKEHPKDADVRHINITTQKEFTFRGILNELIQERESKVAIVDQEVLKIKDQITKWLKGQ